MTLHVAVYSAIWHDALDDIPNLLTAKVLNVTSAVTDLIKKAKLRAIGQNDFSPFELQSALRQRRGL